MLHVLLSRLNTSRLAVTVLIAAQMFGWITYAQESKPGGSAPPPPPPTPPNSLSAVRTALREFDRFLDHHPLLEDQLRLDPPLTANPKFLEKNPELRDFLRANPKVGEGLKLYPHYYLNRALLRQASAPLPFSDFGPLRDLFQQQPKIEQELNENPERVRDPGFLESRPALRDVLTEHPALGHVFLPAPTPGRRK